VLKRRLLILAPILLPLVVCSDTRIQEPNRLLAAADRLALLYNWPEAIPLYAQSETLFKDSGDRRNALAAKFGYLWATANRGVNPATALELSKHLEDPFVRTDRKLLLRALVAKAVLDRNANEVAARDVWEHILSLATTLGDRCWEARAKAEIGQILYMDGDVQSAARMIRDGIVSQFLHFDLGAAIHYSAMVGNGAVESGRPETGLQYSNIALRTAMFVNDIGFPFLAYQGKARALIALHRNAEAEPILKEAIGRARDEHNYSALAQLLIVGGTAAASSDFARSSELLREAADISEHHGFHHVFAWSTFELARLYRDAGKLNDAEVLESKAIKIMRDLEDKYHLPAHLTLLADVEAKQGNFAAADRLYSEATDVIDALLVNVNTRQLKSSLIATLSEAYVGHFELVATKFSDPRRAYEILEKARARSLADTLRGESERMSGADAITIDAQRDINRIQLALLHETDRDARQSLLDQLFTMEQLLSRDRSVESAHGSNINMTRQLIPLTVLQESLRPNEMILEYVLSESRSYCLQITRNAEAIVILPAGRERIEQLVENYFVDVRARQSESISGNELYSVLVKPLRLETSTAKLVVVPDGKLHLLPFDALKDDKGKYVLKSQVVTYTPSATVLHLLRKSHERESANRSFLGVGGVAYSGPTVQNEIKNRNQSKAVATASFADLQAQSLVDLPGSQEEITGIAEIVNGTNQLLLGNDATESGFKALPLGEYHVIHLSVHGIADREFPDRAALVLGPSARPQEDGLLQAREIRDLPLNAELITLTACDTGSGALLGQEGIASLERAFLLAGAKSVVASLWTADDIYTLNLMKRFYRYLVGGFEKGAALREAKLDLIKEYGPRALPIYWAGFTLVGEGSSPAFN
jgi:CHAT domain-containing protein